MIYGIYLLMLLSLGAGKVILPASIPASAPSDAQLLSDPHILVETSSSHLKTDDFDITYRKLCICNKNKRFAYE